MEERSRQESLKTFGLQLVLTVILTVVLKTSAIVGEISFIMTLRQCVLISKLIITLQNQIT